MVMSNQALLTPPEDAVWRWNYKLQWRLFLFKRPEWTLLPCLSGVVAFWQALPVTGAASMRRSLNFSQTTFTKKLKCRASVWHGDAGVGDQLCFIGNRFTVDRNKAATGQILNMVAIAAVINLSMLREYSRVVDCEITLWSSSQCYWKGSEAFYFRAELDNKRLLNVLDVSQLTIPYCSGKMKLQLFR